MKPFENWKFVTEILSRLTKNDLAPSSDRVVRAIDTWYHRGMIIFHRGIDSGKPRGDLLVEQKILSFSNGNYLVWPCLL